MERADVAREGWKYRSGAEEGIGCIQGHPEGNFTRLEVTFEAV
jgi:hypothetical protein